MLKYIINLIQLNLFKQRWIVFARAKCTNGLDKCNHNNNSLKKKLIVFSDSIKIKIF